MKLWRRPLDEGRLRLPHGEIRVIAERCKGCGFCVEYCPRGVLELSAEFNSKGYHLPIPRRIDLCTTCGLCEALCPEFAINCVSVTVEVHG